MTSADGPHQTFQLLIKARWCMQSNGSGYITDMDDCEDYFAPWQGDFITDTCSDSTRQQWNITSRDVDGKRQWKLKNVATSQCLGPRDCASDNSWLQVNATHY